MDYELLKDGVDVKSLTKDEEIRLCDEIRQEIVRVISKNGGHLASNLGVVELTVALHKVFDVRKDKIIWDVGHQCYAHKVLTSRLSEFETIRKEGGISGFTNRSESAYDIFTSGHSSVAVSQAFGVAESNQIIKSQIKNAEKSFVVAVVGDGALTGGLAYEGLNNAGQFKKNFIVILNDNKMSISKNVGAIASYLANLRTRSYYINFKNFVEDFLKKIPLIGKNLNNFLIKSKLALKNILFNNTIFEYLGFAYYGPVDGHDIAKIEAVLRLAKQIDKPVLIHVITKKGKSYSFAEKNPSSFHGVSKFEISSGKVQSQSKNFSKVFGEEMCNLAYDNPKICCITAAMASGTGLSEFRIKFPDRFFDVGIAEEHAVTFSGGLAAGGMLPVVAIYSSFLQRSYDQIIHDVSLQGLKVVFAVDRCGFVGEDGESHQGIFDVGFFGTIPGITVFAPSFFEELKSILKLSLAKPTSCAIRYPRGGELFKPENYVVTENDYDFYFENQKYECLIITYGRIFSNTWLAREKLESVGISCTILKLNVIKPISERATRDAMKYHKIFFFEEAQQSGGIAEKFGFQLMKLRFKGEYFVRAIPDEFVKHATVESQLKKYGFDADSIFSLVSSKF